MNRKTIQKVIDKLGESTPENIAYARGMLDTILEGLPQDEVKIVPKVEVLRSSNPAVLDARDIPIGAGGKIFPGMVETQ